MRARMVDELTTDTLTGLTCWQLVREREEQRKTLFVEIKFVPVM